MSLPPRRPEPYLIFPSENYGSVLRDCAKTIELNPKSSKAYYRSALALVALERYEEALDCCRRYLQFDSDNQSMKSVGERAKSLKEAKEKKEKDRQERLRKEQLKQEQLRAAYRVSLICLAYPSGLTMVQERNIIVKRVPDNVSKSPYSPHFDQEDDSNGSMFFPVLFMYPQYATTDLVSHFHEHTAFSAHLSEMFPPNAPPPEWDKKEEYVDGSLAVYAWTVQRRLLKIGKKMTLRDVLQTAGGKEGSPRDGLEMTDGTLSFVVLPRGAEEQRWVDDFKKTREAQSV